MIQYTEKIEVFYFIRKPLELINELGKIARFKTNKNLMYQ